MMSHGRALVLVTAVLLAGCENGAQPTSPSEAPSLVPGNRPVGTGITITILSTLGGRSSSAQGVNDIGQIAGYSTTAAGSTHAVVWNNGQILDLGPGWATDINRGGEVVGYNAGRALLWRPRSGGGYDPPLSLGTLGGSYSDAQAISDGGQITGNSATASGASHGYLRTGTLMSDIHPASGPLASGASFPWGLNNSGSVVGQWNGTPNQSFLWTSAGGMRLLPTLGGSRGVALDINDNNQVVGWSEPAPGQPDEAYIYENGTIRRLGTLGSAGSVAMAINLSGVVVGRASTGRSAHPFYWTAAGGMKDLGLPKGMSFGQAWDVNSGGWIVGDASGQKSRAILWRLP
jgi:probable HAF family extracellular repeat protein